MSCRSSTRNGRTRRNSRITRRIGGWRCAFTTSSTRCPAAIAPTRDDVSRLLAFGRELSDAETCHLLVHCHAGVSRSTAATALILAQAHPERPAREVLDAVSRMRPRAWPNLRILEFGDELLGRGGEIVAAAGPIYRRVLDREPSLQEAMIEGGRAARSSPR